MIEEEEEIIQPWTIWTMTRPTTTPNTTNTSSLTSTSSSITSNKHYIDYAQLVRPIITIHTLHDFIHVYGHLTRPSFMPINSDYHMFREGVKPMWEDTANIHGGKWMCRLAKPITDRIWEHAILALVGGILSPPLNGNVNNITAIKAEEDTDTITTNNTDTEDFDNHIDINHINNSNKNNDNIKENIILDHEEICGIVLSIRTTEDILSIWNKSALDEYKKIWIKNALLKALSLPSNTLLEYKEHNLSIKDNSSYHNTQKYYNK